MAMLSAVLMFLTGIGALIWAGSGSNKAYKSPTSVGVGICGAFAHSCSPIRSLEPMSYLTSVFTCMQR